MAPLGEISSQESAAGCRKRVCKACDRCRIKKSKCDGNNACFRCRAENSICTFSERKRSHDRIHPKGYVELLEQQQAQLIAGLQELYHRLQCAQLWPGAPLEGKNGHVLVHDILVQLQIRNACQSEGETFEEDVDKLQQRLLSPVVPSLRRLESVSSGSERSHAPGHSSPSSVDSSKASEGKPVFQSRRAINTTLALSPVFQRPRSYNAQRRASLEYSLTDDEFAAQDDILWPDIDLDLQFWKPLDPDSFAQYMTHLEMVPHR